MYSIDKKVSRPSATTIKVIHPATLSQNELELKNLKGKPSEAINGKITVNVSSTSTTTQKREKYFCF